MGTSIQMIITRLHSRAHPSFIPAHNACVFGMETPLRGRSGGHTGTAPTIPNTHRRSAKVKTKNLALAELPQMAKQKIWCLRSFRKDENKKFGACGASANGKTKNLALAELPQMAKQKIWCLRSFRKW